jgi:arylsulfatase A-like enzyme
LSGEVADAGLLDISPTLLELAGQEAPASMQGRSLLDGRTQMREATAALSMDEEEIIRQRLVGLGYIE